MQETWWLADGAREVLEARAPLDVAAWMQPAANRSILSTDRQSAAVRWSGAPALLVKWRTPIAGRRRRTWLRPSRERLEARAMRKAAARGIPAPAPLAVGERRRGGVLVGSVYVRPFDEEARSAEAATRESPASMLDAAAALRRWHDVGLRHGDCYPKNFLVDADGHARLIGCPKATFVAPGPHLDRARLKDLGQFAVGFGALGVWRDPFAFLVAYGETPGLPPYDELLTRVTPFHDRIVCRKHEREQTRPAREPDGPPQPVPLAPTARPLRPTLRPL